MQLGLTTEMGEKSVVLQKEFNQSLRSSNPNSQAITSAERVEVIPLSRSRDQMHRVNAHLALQRARKPRARRTQSAILRQTMLPSAQLLISKLSAELAMLTHTVAIPTTQWWSHSPMASGLFTARRSVITFL